MLSYSLSRTILPLCTLAAITSAAAVSAQITTFSTGYLTPETISQAPSNFGSYGGDLFIPDNGRNNVSQGAIRVVPITGGAPGTFASNLPGIVTGGLFLPSAGWGASSGDYLTVGSSGTSLNSTGQVYAYGSNGASTLIASAPSSFFGGVALAPSTFGSIGGQLVVSDENGRIATVSSAGNVSTFVSLSINKPFGEVFAPTAFGSVGSDLLVSSSVGGVIDAVNGSGSVTQFASIGLQPGQTGLRQMIFAPSGFLPGFSQPLLLVSIAGSSTGGGTLGNIVAIDGSGDIVASLRTDLGLTAFDPRGYDFLNSQSLLVSDASDPSDLITPSAFAPAVPEPGLAALFGAVGVCGLSLLTRRKRR